MAGYLGLFDPAQGDPRQAAINARRQQEIALGQASPDQQIGAARMMAAGNAGAGASQLGRGLFGAATGADISSPEQKLEAVKAKVAAALQGQDLTDPEKVYPVLIRALQEAGLVSQAMQAVKEFEEMRGKAEDRATRRQTADTKAATAAATAEFLRAKAAALQTSPKERILADYAATLGKLEAGEYKDEAEKAALQRLLIAQERTLGVKPEKVGGTWKVTVQQGTATDPARIIKYDSVTGKVETTTLDGKPLSVIDAEADAKKADKPSAPKAANEKTIKDASAALADVSELVRLSGAYQPSFSLKPGAERELAKVVTQFGWGDKVQIFQRLFGSNQAAASWWSAYANLIAQVRHKLFGATLTAGESAAFDAIRALIALPPQAVVDKLKEQATTGFAAVDREVNAFGNTRDLGNVPAQVDALREPINAMRGKTIGNGQALPPASSKPAPAATPSVTVENW